MNMMANTNFDLDVERNDNWVKPKRTRTKNDRKQLHMVETARLVNNVLLNFLRIIEKKNSD